MEPFSPRPTSLPGSGSPLPPPRRRGDKESLHRESSQGEAKPLKKAQDAIRQTSEDLVRQPLPLKSQENRGRLPHLSAAAAAASSSDTVSQKKPEEILRFLFERLPEIEKERSKLEELQRQLHLSKKPSKELPLYKKQQEKVAGLENNLTTLISEQAGPLCDTPESLSGLRALLDTIKIEPESRDLVAQAFLTMDKSRVSALLQELMRHEIASKMKAGGVPFRQDTITTRLFVALHKKELPHTLSPSIDNFVASKLLSALSVEELALQFINDLKEGVRRDASEELGLFYRSLLSSLSDLPKGGDLIANLLILRLFVPPLRLHPKLESDPEKEKIAKAVSQLILKSASLDLTAESSLKETPLGAEFLNLVFALKDS